MGEYINFEKIKYSKCPSCKKHGIPAFRKIGHRYNPAVTCRYCGKEFSVNIVLSIFMKIAIGVLVGSIAFAVKTYLFEVPFLIWIILMLCLWFLCEYFVPLEEIE